MTGLHHSGMLEQTKKNMKRTFHVEIVSRINLQIKERKKSRMANNHLSLQPLINHLDKTPPLFKTLVQTPGKKICKKNHRGGVNIKAFWPSTPSYFSVE